MATGSGIRVTRVAPTHHQKFVFAVDTKADGSDSGNPVYFVDSLTNGDLLLQIGQKLFPVAPEELTVDELDFIHNKIKTFENNYSFGDSSRNVMGGADGGGG